MTTKRHGCCRCYISMFMNVYFPLNEDSINYQECNAGYNNSGKKVKLFCRKKQQSMT